MRKPGFLTKLKEEGKLRIVEPSENIKDSYIKKSESYLDSAKILLNNDKLEEAISMAYYSMYYITQALFFKVGIKCENHTATLILLKRVFNLDNSPLLKAKSERIDKQYYVDFTITKADVVELIKLAEDFNAYIFDFIARLNAELIDSFRQKFLNLIEET